MKLGFVYPGGMPWDALDNWVKTLARHSERHEVVLARCAGDCRGCSAAWIITQGQNFPRERQDQALTALKAMAIPCGIIHNEDTGLAAPGKYPSFCWTMRAFNNLKEKYYNIHLLRMPVFKPIVRYEKKPLNVFTFGHIEPKKKIKEMYEWAKRNEIPFEAIGPDCLRDQYEDYLRELSRSGFFTGVYRWTEMVEDLANKVSEASHFLFVLPESKGGTGGSPTSPRYASLFNRPVIVVDDEMTYAEDGYYVVTDLDQIDRRWLEDTKPPWSRWGVDEYLDALVERTG